MNQNKINKLKQFANDTEMNEAVKEVLLDVFLQKLPNADVNILASQTIAYNFLKDAWIEIDEYRLKVEEETPKKKQVGI